MIKFLLDWPKLPEEEKNSISWISLAIQIAIEEQFLKNFCLSGKSSGNSHTVLLFTRC